MPGPYMAAGVRCYRCRPCSVAAAVRFCGGVKTPPTKAETWYYGADEYMDYFDHHRWELISSSKEYLQNVLESTIKKIQHKLGPGGYNPVGVPVCVEEFI